MRIIELLNPDGSITEMIEIAVSNGHFTQMTKALYDEQQKALKDAAN